MISLCAVLVSTPQARSRIIASSSRHDTLSCSASSPSSTAANATSAPASGLPPCVTRTLAIAFSRIRYCALSARDADLQLVRGQADRELGDAELERRLGEVDHRRRRLVVLAVVAKALPPRERLPPAPGEERVPRRLADPAAQREDADVDVRAPARLDLQRDRRVVAAQRHDLRRDHALALDRDQRRRLAKRHAHLQARRLARLVALLLGQDVDAVVVVLRRTRARPAA